MSRFATSEMRHAANGKSILPTSRHQGERDFRQKAHESICVQNDVVLSEKGDAAMESNHETVVIEKALSRVKRVCRVIQRGCEVLLAATLLAMVVLVVLFIVQGLVGNWPLPIEVSAKTLMVSLPSGALAMVFLKVVSGIFKDVAESGSPFREKQVAKIRLLAYLLFAKALLEAVLSIGSSMFVQIGSYNISYVGNSGMFGMSVNIDGGAILVGVLTLCLSVVFEYGSLLQRFTDETA